MILKNVKKEYRKVGWILFPPDKEVYVSEYWYKRYKKRIDKALADGIFERCDKEITVEDEVVQKAVMVTSEVVEAKEVAPKEADEERLEEVKDKKPKEETKKEDKKDKKQSPKRPGRPKSNKNKKQNKKK